MTIENEARRKLQDNIRRLRDMGTYRGRRHAIGLPVRGQRTRTQVCHSPNTQYLFFLGENPILRLRKALTAKKLNRVERHG